MKTLYFETSHYVRREGNVIDFCDYRDRVQRSAAHAVAPAVGDAVSFQWETDASVWHDEEEESVRVHPVRRQPRRTALRLADFLELCAAGATLALVLTVWLQFLF